VAVRAVLDQAGEGVTQLALMDPGVVLAPGDAPDRDTWCTPKWLARAVGPFDLDACTNSRSHVDALQSCSLERGVDGLAFAPTVPSFWRVWINPPYSAGQVIRWVRAYQHTRFCFLVRLDPSTEWFAELYAASEVLMVPRGRRIDFEPPPGVKASSNPFPHVLAYADHRDVTPAIEAMCFEWRAL
jgi:hypothetical protein